MIPEEAEKHGKWLAVDPDGSARVFRCRPEMIAGMWVPSEFKSDFAPACVDAGRFPGMEGRLMRRRRKGGEYRWEIETA
jgi:hypothetical protein